MSSDVPFSRAKLILDLTKCKIHRSIIEYVARKARSSVKTGSRLKVYESLNDKALDVLHNAFVRCETDKILGTSSRQYYNE